jgi:NAD(P)-dependent dehydrogenase (short-subunit alcohol dehydrogenase family)
LTLRFAMELGRHGITVNAVAPGFVQTEMSRGTDEDAWKERVQKIGAAAMLGRIGEADDIANAVTLFASPDSGWVTAQVLAVDGGRMDYIGR